MTPEHLFRVPHQISTEATKSAEKAVISTVQKRLILRAMFDAYSPNSSTVESAAKYTSSYTLNTDGTKSLNFKDISPEERQTLIENFRVEPMVAHRIMRSNLLTILKDTNFSEAERKSRLERYFIAFLELIPKLDKMAFPPTDSRSPLKGVPAYIPDGLSDLGRDPEVDEAKRSWEKIRVIKSRFYKKVLPDLIEMLCVVGFDRNLVDESQQEMMLLNLVLKNTHKALEFDRKNYAENFGGKSVPIDYYRGTPEPASVCRHIAMDAQLCLQALGIESRLLKCRVDNEGHVANLVNIETQWYFADPTNPDLDPDTLLQNKPFIRPIILNQHVQQTWVLIRFKLKNPTNIVPLTTTYHSWNLMYYRIIDNDSNPLW